MENGLFGTGILSILFIVLAVICLILIALVIFLFVQLSAERKRLDRFMVGASGKDLESVIRDRFERVDDLEEAQADTEAELDDIEKQLDGAYQKLGIVKYDAFMENGGKLSFALALLNEHDNGFLMNVMNSRDGSYSYVKIIKSGKCDIALGKEEAEALKRALAI